MAGHPLFAALYDRMTRAGRARRPRRMRGVGARPARGPDARARRRDRSNAAHYPAAVTELVLTEPDPHMARRLREKLAALAAAVRDEVVEAGAEGCRSTTTPSTPSPRPWSSARSTTRRGRGRRSPACCARTAGCCCSSTSAIPATAGSRRWQDRLGRPWGWFAGGCHPNRDTAGDAAPAPGFDVSALEPAELPGRAAARPARDPGLGRAARPGRRATCAGSCRWSSARGCCR